MKDLWYHAFVYRSMWKCIAVFVSVIELPFSSRMRFWKMFREVNPLTVTLKYPLHFQDDGISPYSTFVKLNHANDFDIVEYVKMYRQKSAPGEGGVLQNIWWVCVVVSSKPLPCVRSEFGLTLIPCLRLASNNAYPIPDSTCKINTLSQSKIFWICDQKAETHSLNSGTYPYIAIIGVPSPSFGKLDLWLPRLS